MPLGYDQQLFILAFDHRGSFQKKMFGIAGDPNPEETAKIIDAKAVIAAGFAKALEEGAQAGTAGILVDELDELAPSDPLPFQLDDDNLSETTRLTHRVRSVRASARRRPRRRAQPGQAQGRRRSERREALARRLGHGALERPIPIEQHS